MVLMNVICLINPRISFHFVNFFCAMIISAVPSVNPQTASFANLLDSIANADQCDAM
jgi:hypothetical protein